MPRKKQGNTPNKPRSKREAFDQFWKEDHLFVHLDARRVGVQVPSHLSNQPSLTLQLSQYFQGATELSEESITSYLKFSGNYFECVIPWGAIWGLTSAGGERLVFPLDLPRELLFDAAKAELQQLGSAKDPDQDHNPTTAAVTPPPTPRTVPRLTPLEGGATDANASAAPAESPGDAVSSVDQSSTTPHSDERRRRPTLHRIK